MLTWSVRLLAQCKLAVNSAFILFNSQQEALVYSELRSGLYNTCCSMSVSLLFPALLHGVAAMSTSEASSIMAALPAEVIADTILPISLNSSHSLSLVKRSDAKIAMTKAVTTFAANLTRIAAALAKTKLQQKRRYIIYTYHISYIIYTPGR